MAALEQPCGVWVPGIPKPKGSMKCVGKRGKVKHKLLEQVDNTAWRRRVTLAGAKLPVQGITGPVGLSVTFTLPRPQSHYGTGRNAHRLKPDAPAWPTGHGTGDWEKLARIIGDAWQTKGGAGVLADDAQIVNGTVWKCYPDTRGCPDRRDQPGAVIRLYPIEEDDQCQPTLIASGLPAKSSSGTGRPRS